MNSIIGNIRDFFSDTKSKISTIQYSELQSLSLNNVPLITYVLIGVTTVILASYTIIDSGNKDKEGDDEGEESSSMIDKLPSTEGIKETISNINPFKSSSDKESPKEEEDNEEEEEEDKNKEPPGIVGGRRKHKKKHTHKKIQNKNKKSHKNKK